MAKGKYFGGKETVTVEKNEIHEKVVHPELMSLIAQLSNAIFVIVEENIDPNTLRVGVTDNCLPPSRRDGQIGDFFGIPAYRVNKKPEVQYGQA